jgi:hypothetical protein
MSNPDTTEPSPAEVFLNLIAAFLTPMFLAPAGGDPTYARMAALETVNSYGVRTLADLLPVAQIIAFGFATLASLNQSMADNIAVSLALRLRGNAASLNRAAEACRRALTQAPNIEPDTQQIAEREQQTLANLAEVEQRFAAATAPAPTAQPAAAAQAPIPAAPLLPSRPRSPAQEKADKIAWAGAMTRMAREYTADLANLPPHERKVAIRRAALLSTTAHNLLTGTPAPTP